MKEFKRKFSAALTNLNDQFNDLYTRLMQERREAITNAVAITEFVNDELFQIYKITFIKPIKIQWFDRDDFTLYTDSCLDVTNMCGTDIYVTTDDGNEVSIEQLTADSLKSIVKVIEKSIITLCLRNSDEEFYELPYEEFKEKFHTEYDLLYDWHVDRKIV